MKSSSVHFIVIVKSWLFRHPVTVALCACMALSFFNLRGGYFVSQQQQQPSKGNDEYSLNIPFLFSSSLSTERIRKQEQLNRIHHIPDSIQTLPSKKQQTLIVGLANREYVDLAAMWYRRMTDAGYTNHLILAADKTTAWICQNMNMRYDTLYNVTSQYLSKCPNTDPIQGEWNKKTYLFASRWMYARQKLLEGYHVLLTDVDAVYNFHVPPSVFENDIYDHYTAYANKMPESIFKQTGFTVCGCFNWMRSTPSMIHFINLLLANCGCIPEKNNNDMCRCGCDDQVTMNSMMFYQLDLVWDGYTEDMLDVGKEFLLDSLTGYSQSMDYRVKILDRTFVYRGHRNNTCSTGNWITFPKKMNTEPKVEQMKLLLSNCPLRNSSSDTAVTTRR